MLRVVVVTRFVFDVTRRNALSPVLARFNDRSVHCNSLTRDFLSLANLR